MAMWAGSEESGGHEGAAEAQRREHGEAACLAARARDAGEPGLARHESQQEWHVSRADPE